jgi:hypothetical protein
MHRYLDEKKVATRAQILTRFGRDDQAAVRGILNDLVESGLVYRTGRGDSTVYRIAPEEDLRQALRRDSDGSDEALAWVMIYRKGPLSRAELSELLPIEDPALDRVLAQLIANGRITATESGGTTLYRADQCFIPLGDTVGWEAALLDHYQGVVSAICVKLRNGATRALPDDQVGGSTFSFDVWPDHPLEERVSGLLARFRKDVGALWDEVTEHNKQGKPDSVTKVTFYFGQLVKRDEPEGDD